MKSKLFLTILACLLFSTMMQAQVTIGSNKEPDGSAVLDIDNAGINKGVLFPKVSLDDVSVWGLANATSVEGMVVYNIKSTTIGASGDTRGVYFWDGAMWKRGAESSTVNIRRVNANTTLIFTGANPDNILLVDAGSNNVTVTIPAGIPKGRAFTIKRVDNSVNTVNVDFGAAFVDETDHSINVGTKVTYMIVVEDTNKWQTISRF